MSYGRFAGTVTRLSLSVLLVGLALLPATTAFAGTITVGPAGPPSYNYATIQAAINAANNTGDTIQVTAGTYRENLVWNTKSIQLIGAGAASSIVNGDLNSDGTGDGSCLRMTDVPATARIEGFTFTKGRDMQPAPTMGAGLSLVASHPTITSCVLTSNGGVLYGGAIYCGQASSPTITGNTITGNSATYGGGIVCSNYSSPTISNNAISSNTAEISGGGIHCIEHSSPSITSNTISSNTATAENGGGISCADFSSPTISSNTIANNEANLNGGGVHTNANNCEPTIQDNLMTGNTAVYAGGAINCTSLSPEIADNTISGNSAGSGGGIGVGGSCSATIEGNTLSDNDATNGGAIACASASPTITDNVLSENSSTNNGGAIYCSGTSAAMIEDNTIEDNAAGQYGGGITCSGSAPTIVGNTFSGNSAPLGGGGVHSGGDSSPDVFANIIIGNTTAGGGGGIRCGVNSLADIAGNTVYGNSAAQGGGIYCTSTGSPTITNTIVAFSTGGGGIHVEAGGAPTISYCDVYGNTGGNYSVIADQTGANGNISQDPLFADAPGGDFHLKSMGGRWNGVFWVTDSVHSPCIDSGDPASPFADEPSPNGGRVNAGRWGNTAEASKSFGPTLTLAWAGTNGFSNDGVAPDSGVAGTLFTCKVKYTGPAPDFVRLRLYYNGAEVGVSPLAMAPLSGSPETGQIFIVKKALTGTKSYAYRFEARCGSVWAAGMPSALHDGPVVCAASPVLSWAGTNGFYDDGVAPNTGVAGTLFTYKVKYTGPVPDFVRLRLYYNGVEVGASPIAMAPLSGTPATGQIFIVKKTLSGTKPYAYRFEARSGGVWATGAPTLQKSGPLVTAVSPATIAMVSGLACAAGPTGARTIFTLSGDMAVTMEVTNIAGRPIRTLVTDRQMPAGVNELYWDGRSNQGLLVPNGTYLIHLTSRAADGAQARAVTTLQVVR